jgi:uncharacterized membrane protein
LLNRVDKVIDQLQAYGGCVMQSSLSHTDEARLKTALKAGASIAA